MKTVLSQFSAGFQEAVHPLNAPLEHALWCLREAPETTAVRGVLPALEDAALRFQRLQKRVADQQAYVLIFGPLKSGKSTLMNALAGSYVSEVTALPAYPCMVYVGHSRERNFTLTRYNGERQAFSDLDGLRVVLNWAHAELAGKIRETEKREVAFDPAAHFPEAVKRVDVRVPARNLQNSGAVLVDTPGLYTRMKFGYDQMTREFRDTAACAIFVVKTDNLFLEQVFEEFQDLLK
ncbi:MAG: dynamin family protein, partial [Planctomycetota bacterium]